MRQTRSREQNPIRQVAERLVYSNRWVRVYFDRVGWSDGRCDHRTRIVEGEGGEASGVVVLAFTRPGSLLLVRQYRYAVSRQLLELPRGFGQAGHSPAQNALRELEEETGYTASKIRRLGTLFPNSGLLATRTVVFLATGLSKQEGSSQAVGQEGRAVELSMAEVEKRVAAGKITDAHTLAALHLYKLKYPRLGMPPKE